MKPPTKKRKLKQSATEEVVFDPSARFDYLTGFHKRKVQRAKHAQEIAARKMREERIDQRKRLREERKADLERHVKEVNALLPSRPQPAESEDEDKDGDNDEDWEGIIEAAPVPVDHEDEYIDEDRYTTVVVEEVDISRDGISKVKDNIEDVKDNSEPVQQPPTSNKEKKSGSGKKTKDKDKKPRKKKKNFRYESPADRKMNRAKESARKSKAAKIRRGD